MFFGLHFLDYFLATKKRNNNINTQNNNNNNNNNNNVNRYKDYYENIYLFYIPK